MLTCQECGPYGVAGMMPVVQEGVTTYRPCSTCNPTRYAVWQRYGQSPMLASSKFAGGAVAHDGAGFPEGWHGPRNVRAPLPSERGFGQPGQEQIGMPCNPPPQFGAALELSTEAMRLPPGSPERTALVEEIDALVDEMEKAMRRKAGR